MMLRLLMIAAASLVLVLTPVTKAAALTWREFFQGSNIEYLDKNPDDLPTCPTTGGAAGPVGGGAVTTNVASFVDTYGQSAFNVGKKSGIPYDAILGQAILESNYGQSSLTKEANNFFGIKAGSSWTGPTVSKRTAEQNASGGVYYVEAKFRAYATPEAGFQGYADFIKGNPRYAKALNYPQDPVGYIRAIRDAGYATDVSYVDKVANRISAVQQYIASKNLFPPSSQVVYDVQPPAGASAGGTPAAATGSTACTAAPVAANGTSVTLEGVAFPLVGNKSTVKNPSIFNNGTTDKAAHPYIAYDISANTGTPVAAFMEGTVNTVSTDRCGGRFISIYNAQKDMTISYMHMSLSGNIANGTQVKAGDRVGFVGTVAEGCTVAHLHIDAIKGRVRVACSRLSCPPANQALFLEIGPDLFKTFQLLAS